MIKIELVYDPMNGFVIQDGRINDYIDNICSISESSGYCEIKLTIGSETLLTELRARHKEKRLIIEEQILYKPKGYATKGDCYILTIDDDGRLDHYPKGFSDYTDDALMRLLYTGVQAKEG